MVNSYYNSINGSRIIKSETQQNNSTGSKIFIRLTFQKLFSDPKRFQLRSKI